MKKETNKNMITDLEMIELGFRKVKTCEKKQRGVSSFCWYKNGFYFTIEKFGFKDFCDEKFKPTLRLGGKIKLFSDINEVKQILKIFHID